VKILTPPQQGFAPVQNDGKIDEQSMLHLVATLTSNCEIG
jgi:hypothetical protein